MKIEQIIADIIKAEGGFIHHPNDIGGPTNMGITQETLSNWISRQASIDDVRNLTVKIATEIYMMEYYKKPKFNLLHPKIQPIVVDASVLFGPRRAGKFIQKIANDINLAGEFGYDTLIIDGLIGEKTVIMVSNICFTKGLFALFINAYVEERIEYHRQRVAKRSDQQIFLNGWVNRSEKFRV